MSTEQNDPVAAMASAEGQNGVSDGQQGALDGQQYASDGQQVTGSNATDDEFKLLLAEKNRIAELYDKSNRDLMQHVYVCIPDPDDRSKLIEMDTITPKSRFRIQIGLSFDMTQSNVSINARFDREGPPSRKIAQNYQRIALRLYKASFEKILGDMSCDVVKSIDEIPPGLKNFDQLAQVIEAGEMYCIRLKFKKDYIYQEGLYDTMGFTDTGSLAAVAFLKQVMDSGLVKMYQQFSSSRFANDFELLKVDIARQCRPFREYYGKIRPDNQGGFQGGNPVLQWGTEAFGPDKDRKLTHPASSTFRNIEQYMFIHGYGTLRNEAYSLVSAEDTLKIPMKAAFVQIEGFVEDGLPSQYIAFVDCQDQELIRSVYSVGNNVTVCFTEPSTEGKAKPQGWKAEVKQPIPSVYCPDALILHVRRPKGDKFDPPDYGYASLDMEFDIQIWLYPELSDLSGKRLVNATKLLHSSKNVDLQRYALGRDLSPNEERILSINADSVIWEQVNKHLAKLTQSQQEAIHAILGSKRPFVFIQGPPGTGKTFFIVVLMRILCILGMKSIAAAPSNAATDNLASMLEEHYPELGAVRFHPWDSEQSAIRRFKVAESDDTSTTASLKQAGSKQTGEQQPTSDLDGSQSHSPNASKHTQTLAKPAETKEDHATTMACLEFLSDTLNDLETKRSAKVQQSEQAVGSERQVSGKNGQAPQQTAESEDETAFRFEGLSPEQIESQLKDDELALGWNLCVAKTMADESTWKAPNRQRPNKKTISLHVRVLQMARMIEDGPAVFKQSMDAVLEEKFKNMLREHTAFSEIDDVRIGAKQLETEMLENALTVTRALVTTLSNTAHAHLNRIFKYKVSITDESANATEVESLLPVIHKTTEDYMPLSVHVGDHKQLPPTVKSRGRFDKEGRPVNPFAEQLSMSFMMRMANRGHPIITLTEQHRAVEGLEAVYNECFYGGVITNGPGTKIGDRPAAQKALEYLRRHYNIDSTAPHVYLNVSSGKCMVADSSKSRFNLHNIVVTLFEIKRMLDEEIWTEKQITIQTPYRAQAAKYRLALDQADMHIAVMTTDSMQGGENECVIWDVVLARCRKGSAGFVRDPTRINVAVSRARNMFILVADLKGLEVKKQDNTELEWMAQEELEKALEVDKSINADLTKVYDFYLQHSLVRAVSPEKCVDQHKFVDWAMALTWQPLNNKSFICHKCEEPGHRASECSAEKRPRCHVCSQLGHYGSQCDFRQCYKCGERGHSKTECTGEAKAKCKKCRSFDHEEKDCTGEETRTCRKCAQKGHITKDCSLKGGLRPSIPHIGDKTPNVGEDVPEEIIVDLHGYKGLNKFRASVDEDEAKGNDQADDNEGNAAATWDSTANASANSKEPIW